MFTTSFKKFIFKTFIIMLFAMTVFGLSAVVSEAADLGLDAGESIGLGNADPKIVITNIIRIVLAFLGILAVSLIIYGGFLWMTSNGNEERVDKAKKLIINAVIGLLIILASFGIASFVISQLSDATGLNSGEESGEGGGGTISGGGSIGATCDPVNAPCEPGLLCDPSTLTCVNGEGVGAACDPVNNPCGSGLLCDPASLTCVLGGGVGATCDGDESNAVCDPDNALCSYGNVCGETSCLCEQVPIIEWLSPGDGAVGNIITIGGINFGDTPGQVLFSDGSDFTVLAEDPGALNPLCDSSWQDDQITVVVPQEAVSGAIRVVRADEQSDDSNDEQGPSLDNFTINNIIRPGLCQLDPTSGQMEDIVSYYGINLGTVEAAFGSYEESVSALNSTQVDITRIDATVPNIGDGRTTTFVTDSSGEPSNYLRFRKLAEDTQGPFISQFQPSAGAIGQYVTINGSGFGNFQGNSKVYFGDIEASYDFPEICSESVWSDKQVIVKVPEGISDNSYTISMELASVTIDSNGTSPSTFVVDNSIDLYPSLCRIEPIMGQPGEEINIWGEYFDDFDPNYSNVEFYPGNNVNRDTISFWDTDFNAGAINRPDLVTTIIPNNAQTGPVRISKTSANLFSNGINLSIGTCLEAAPAENVCGPQICCPSSTFEAGSCRENINDCSIDIVNSSYEWEFNTSVELTSIPPGWEPTGETCDYECDSTDCVSGDCSYDASVDRCVDNIDTACSLPLLIQDNNGVDAESRCVYDEVDNRYKNYIEIPIELDCPLAWEEVYPLGVNNEAEVRICVNQTLECDPCATGFNCEEPVGGAEEGLCSVPVDVCDGPEAICSITNECITPIITPDVTTPTSTPGELACGCDNDNQCGNVDFIGCSAGACCQDRPRVLEPTIPNDEATGICTNTAIIAEFNNLMDISSFVGNMIVVGEYNGVCPSGTEYLAKAGEGFEDKNIIVRTSYQVLNIVKNSLAKILGKTAVAGNPPSSSANYCAISGTVSAEHRGEAPPGGEAVGSQYNSTLIKFAPDDILDTGRRYYVIIRGDNNRQDEIHQGVESFGLVGLDASNSPVDNTATFNGISYRNSYIWEFTTMRDTSTAGICAVDNVRISPDAYLFNTLEDNLDENDNDASDRTYDTKDDQDKNFVAHAFSSTQQPLLPTPSYDWEWNWTIQNESVVEFNDSAHPANAENQLVEARAGQTDAQTQLYADLSLSSNPYNLPGDGVRGTADIQLFICENPWPEKVAGTWRPWSDAPNNCSAEVGASCPNYNYDIYYCRDDGDFGTVDDLPLIMSEDAIIRGQIDDLLKETYFLRESAPDISSSAFNHIVPPEGGALEFNWNEAIAANTETIDSYKLYFSKNSSLPFTDSVTVDVTEAPYQPGIDTFRVEGLENQQTYYFALTAVYEGGAESDYSDIIRATPNDTLAPAKPSNLNASIVNGNTVQVAWTTNTDDTVSYNIKYGLNHALYGAVIPVDGRESGRGEFRINNQDSMYFITVTAVDAYGNESEAADEIILIPSQAKYTFQNALTNVSFEDGGIGGVPSGWSRSQQAESSVGIVDQLAFTGNQSLNITQNPEIPYPGVCGEELANRQAPMYDSYRYSFVWDGDSCQFPDNYYCLQERYAPTYCDIPAGDSLIWGSTNRVMWARFAYNVSDLDWQIGEDYLVAFYYRGDLAAPLSPRLAYNLGHGSQCTPFNSTTGQCVSASAHQCENDPNRCCSIPTQQSCFSSVSLDRIPAGNYNDGEFNGWNLYFDTFTYTAELDLLRNAGGDLRHEIGASIGYNNTGADGTDFYIDDFIVAQRID